MSSGAFALGATTAASVGQLANRALETAALSCTIAGLLLLLVGVIRTLERPRLHGKRRTAGRRD